jgi:hypothetical protein
VNHFVPFCPFTRGGFLPPFLQCPNQVAAIKLRDLDAGYDAGGYGNSPGSPFDSHGHGHGGEGGGSRAEDNRALYEAQTVVLPMPFGVALMEDSQGVFVHKV